MTINAGDMVYSSRKFDREERFLERQRGAGPRNINLAFDLELPGVPRVSKTPLKPQKSSRLRKTPEPKLLLSQSIRKTPGIAKVLPSLSSRRTPATARRRATKEPSTVASATEGNSIHHTGISEIAQASGEKTGTKKRKALEDISENQIPALPRKRRKRKSIGQQSLTKKPRASSRAKPTTPVLKAASRSRKAQDDKPELSEVIAEQPDKTVQEDERTQLTAKPQTRKRKPISQAQKSKKEPATVHPDAPENQEEVAEQVQEAANLGSSAELASVQPRVPSKPRKRKRRLVVQSPKKRKKPSPEELPPIVEESADISTAAAPRDPAASPATAAGAIKAKGTKRGRKPKSTPQGHVKPSEELTGPALTAAISDPAQADAPQADEVQSQSPGDLMTPKRKGRKRKSISQNSFRKKKDLKCPPGPQSGTEISQPEVSQINTPAEAAVAPATRRKGRSKKGVAPPEGTEDVALGSIPDVPQPAEAPKKRGRPKKIKTADNPAKPFEIIQSSTEKKKQKDLSEKAKFMNHAATAPSAVQPPFIAGAYAPTAVQQPAPEQPPVVKKRGRPKKQATALPVAEPSTLDSTSFRPIAQPKQPNIKVSSADTSNLVTKSISANSHHFVPTHALEHPDSHAVANASANSNSRPRATNFSPISKLPATCARSKDHRSKRAQTVDEPDPLSDISPAKPPAKPRPTKAGPWKQPTVQKSSPQEPSNRNNVRATFNHPIATATATSPPPPHRNHHKNNPSPPAQPSSFSSSSTQHQANKEHLSTEEHTYHHNLHIQHTQRALNLAEQSHRDLQARSSTSTSTSRQDDTER
ncbi:MAG: hypothetical protein L6R39_007637 [Caloplaca ligustica]|nr:MAG: hypothetical protein L6R39_007637 [Caloplaca ligustica]